MPGLWLGPEGQLGNDGPLPRQRLVKAAIFFGIDDIDAARDNSDAAARQSAEMRGGVDAAGKAGNNDNPVRPRDAARSRLKRRPFADALRAPTTATIGR